MKKCNLALLAVILFLSQKPSQAETMRLAVMDLIANNVPRVEARAVTDLIRADLVDSGMFTVVERSQMDEILKEQALQQMGCTDNACAVKVGKLLSANKILIGEMSKIGGTIILTVRIVDVEKGVAEVSSTERVKSADALDVAVGSLVKRLVDTLGGKRITDLAGVLEIPENFSATDGVYSDKIVITWSPVKEADKYYVFKEIKGKYELIFTTKETAFTDKNVKYGERYYYRVRAGVFSRFSELSSTVSGMCGKSVSGYYLRGLIPGWGQLYYRNDTKGYIFLTGFAVFTGALGYSLYDYNAKKDAYDGLDAKSSKSRFDPKYNDYNKAANMAINAAGIWALWYAANWIDLLWFTKPVFADDSGSGKTGANIEINIYNRQLSNGKVDTVGVLSINCKF